MLRLILGLSLLASALSFSNPAAFARPRASIRTFMFSGDSNSPSETRPSPEPSPVATETTVVTENSSFAASTEPKGMVVKNLSKGEVIEVKWRDPAMEANISPFQMEWWAYFLVIFPFVLLANDFLHFLPTEGPLAFLSHTQ